MQFYVLKHVKRTCTYVPIYSKSIYDSIYRCKYSLINSGASEPRNMAYMTRLGLWGAGTPFNEFNDFIQAVERR